VETFSIRRHLELLRYLDKRYDKFQSARQHKPIIFKATLLALIPDVNFCVFHVYCRELLSVYLPNKMLICGKTNSFSLKTFCSVPVQQNFDEILELFNFEIAVSL
jgi:hypothetical protein